MSTLGPLADESPEPMARDNFVAVQKRIRECWNGSVVVPKKDVQRMLDEIRWLKRRLRRVEHAIEPLVESLRSGE